MKYTIYITYAWDSCLLYQEVIKSMEEKIPLADTEYQDLPSLRSPYLNVSEG